MQRVILDSDVRTLGTISAPTLVLHRKDNTYSPAVWGRYLAAHIDGAAYVELPGEYTGRRRCSMRWRGSSPDEGQVSAERVLATVLFADIVGSTALAAQLGDREWGRCSDAFGRPCVRISSASTVARSTRPRPLPGHVRWPGPNGHADQASRTGDSLGTADRSGRAIKRGEEIVALCVDLAALVALQLGSHDRPKAAEHLCPDVVTETSRGPRADQRCL